MHEIAARAGVGKATVSLALRDDPRLRAETRRRIQRLAAKMGYRTNATVANLMAQLRASRNPKYHANLGLLNTNADPDALASHFTSRQWIDGCRARAKLLGYGLDEFWLHEPGMNPAALASMLESRNIRGLVISPLQDRGTLPDRCDAIWNQFAGVVVGLRPAWPPLDFSSNDQFSTAFLAVQRLWQRGYRRIGLVLGAGMDALVDRRFSAGFWAGHEAVGGNERVPVFPFQPDGEAAFGAWWSMHRPDAILTPHEEVKPWIDALGIDVPGDVGLAHLDRHEDLPEWSGMNQNHARVGSVAIDLLVGKLHRNESGLPDCPAASFVQSTWVDGTTTQALAGMDAMPSLAAAIA
jgi:LacI family transcriptional regulator